MRNAVERAPGWLPKSPRLLGALRDALRARRYGPRTAQVYRRWVVRFVRHHGMRHPAELGEVEISAFLTHLAALGKGVASTQNQALAALLFLYRHVLLREVGELGEVVRARRARRLPVVLSCDEVRLVLGRLEGGRRLVASML